MPLSQCSIIFVCAVFLIFQQLTTGLECYECENCPTVDSNSGKKTFGAGYSCFKSTSIIQGNSIVRRGAMQNCVSEDTNDDFGSVSTKCCTTDRCNTDQSITDLSTTDRSTTDQSNTGVALSTSFSLAIFISAISVLFRAMIIS